MAGKSIVLFVRSMPNFGLDGEPSPTNLALASPAVEKEAMHIANTPLARHPTGAREEDGQEGRQPWSDVVAHRYTSTFSPVSDTPPSRFRVVGIHTPRGGYGKGLFSALSPKEKGEAESIASTPKRVKRHLSPPPITRPGGQYESEDEKVLKGPNVIQLLRTIVGLKKDNQKLTD